MQVSFGPRSDQYLAYITGKPPRDLPPGTTGRVIDVEKFYEQTRARGLPFTFSLISFAAPLVAFAAALWLIVCLLSFGPQEIREGAVELENAGSNPPLPIDVFCGPGRDPLVNGLIANTFHFSVTHVALFAICALAVLAAAASIRNVLETHGHVGSSNGAKFLGLIVALGVPILAGFGVFKLASWAVGTQIGGLFQRLFPVSAALLAKCDFLKDVNALNDQIYAQMGLGAMAVSIGVVSLTFAAALLGWRFETKDINGAWSDSYVLRHKINNALTLFFIGSILLVVTTVALSSATDWTGGVLDAVKAATAPDSKDATTSNSAPAATPVVATGAPAATATDRAATSAASPNTPALQSASGQSSAGNAADAAAKAAALEFDSLKTLKTSITSFAGALGSLLLILIFVPALYCLTGEIDIAGKTHASFDAANKAPAPTTPEASPAVYVKDRHGKFFSVEVVAGSDEQAPAILSVMDIGGTTRQLKLVAAPGKPPLASYFGEDDAGNIYEFTAPPASQAAPKKPASHAVRHEKADAVKWKVAGWKTVQDWKDNHGLKLQFGDLTATFVAVLAPLLSGTIIDLSKMSLG